MAKDLFGNEIIEDILLRDKFLEPPFSVLDTRQGSWQNRKRRWKSLGMKSEIGRSDELTYTGAASKFDYYRVKEGKRDKTDEQSTSIFDPALTELMYNWFCPKNGTILDPFAGGSVRGIVANYLGYKYTGIELRQEQVDSNREQALNILEVNNQPQWYCGDSEKVLSENWNTKFDMIFSCPPYADLEVYSDLPEDLSNMDYKNFLIKYRSIIDKSLKLLKPNCFAVFVVGEVRGKDGFYYDFVGDTKRAFIEQGAKLYNDCVLLNVVGSASMRAGKVFEASKKLTKIHQNVLIFKS
jgi:16S rRNA G966 N2-methylase RsmD